MFFERFKARAVFLRVGVIETELRFYIQNTSSTGERIVIVVGFFGENPDLRKLFSSRENEVFNLPVKVLCTVSADGEAGGIQKLLRNLGLVICVRHYLALL